MRLFIALLAFLAVAAGSIPTQAQAQAQAPKREKPLVFVINWRGCEQACNGLVDYFSRGNVEITMRDAKQNREAVAEFVKEARRLRPDVIVTWGGEVTLETVGAHDAVDPAKHITDIPVVYMYVAGAKESKIAKSDEVTGRHNLAGTDYVVPLSAQVNAMHAYRPFRTMGMLYDPSQQSSVLRMRQMEELGKTMNYRLVALPVALGPDGKPLPSSIPELNRQLAAQGAEFVYFGFSSFLVQQAKTFTATAVEQRLPVFSGGQLPVVEGDALMAFYTRLDQIGALAGAQIDRILAAKPGTSMADLPIARLRRYSMTINMEVARKLDMYPPISMVRIAEFIKQGK